MNKKIKYHTYPGKETRRIRRRHPENKIKISFDNDCAVELPDTPESRALVLSAVAGGVFSWLNGIKGFNEAMTTALNKQSKGKHAKG